MEIALLRRDVGRARAQMPARVKQQGTLCASRPADSVLAHVTSGACFAVTNSEAAVERRDLTAAVRLGWRAHGSSAAAPSQLLLQPFGGQAAEPGRHCTAAQHAIGQSYSLLNTAPTSWVGGRPPAHLLSVDAHPVHQHGLLRLQGGQARGAVHARVHPTHGQVEQESQRLAGEGGVTSQDAVAGATCVPAGQGWAMKGACLGRMQGDAAACARVIRNRVCCYAAPGSVSCSQQSRWLQWVAAAIAWPNAHELHGTASSRPHC